MAGYIYLIKSLDLYKIGKAINAQKRFTTYKTHNPHGVEMILAIRVRKHDRVERKFHAKFKEKRITGEWFNLSQEDIDYIKNFLYENETSLLNKMEREIYEMV